MVDKCNGYISHYKGTSLCNECKNELWKGEIYPRYIFASNGLSIGCTSCIEEHEFDLVCGCTDFKEQLDTVYTYRGTNVVIGCSACVDKVSEFFL